MKKIILLSSLLSCFLLTACGEEKVYTVDEFVASKDLRTEYQKKCDNGELNGEALQNCDNLFKAKLSSNRVTNGSWK